MPSVKSRVVRAHITPFQIQKKGNAVQENDDAYAPLEIFDVRARRLRVAVSDGATEGFQSGRWATHLVHEFVRRRTLDVARITTRARDRWDDWLRQYLEDRSRTRPLHWYEEAGLERGAFASLIGLDVEAHPHEVDGDRWQAIALGDSCLFHVRDLDLLATFPLSGSADFNNRPVLIASNMSYEHAGSVGATCRVTGSWQTDDTFYLATDAMARWLFTQVEEGREPWSILRDLDTEDQMKVFDEWIAELRSIDELKNDDVTLVRVDLTAGWSQ